MLGGRGDVEKWRNFIFATHWRETDFYSYFQWLTLTCAENWPSKKQIVFSYQSEEQQQLRLPQTPSVWGLGLLIKQPFLLLLGGGPAFVNRADL